MNYLNYFVTPNSFAAIFIVCFFIFITRDSWRFLIKQGALKIKNKYFTFNSGQEKQGDSEEDAKLRKLYKDLGIKKIEDLYSLFEANKRSVEESKNQQNNLFLLWRQYMLLFFNLYLVPRSKLALIWLFNNPNSTKDMFLLNINIPQELENKELEREAVFNALVVHSLIQKDERDLYKITNIGIDFLKFIGVLK